MMKRSLIFVLLSAMGLVLLAPSLALPHKASSAIMLAPPEGFAHPAIKARWEKDDNRIDTAPHVWMWGPGPFYTDYEPLAGVPEGNHLVQYFDKGRLEINDPHADQSSPWYVTSGLLVKEMVAGAAETGSGGWYKLGPASVEVAGDGGNTTGPTYAHFSALTGRAANRLGQPMPGNSYLRRDGDDIELVGGVDTPARVSLARYEEASGHNWAAPFWDFVNSPTRPSKFDWLYTLGYPITEPYWVDVPINGKQIKVLVQLFERRTLTYNLTNPTETQVEMGNVGRHHWHWRYAGRHAAQMDTQYNARIGVGPAPGRAIQLQENITLTNGTGAPLDRVVLRAVWNHWQGVFALQGMKANGQDVEVAWRHGINLEVRLPRHVAPGARLTLELSADLKPRPVGGRTGYDKTNDILSLGDMLPTVVPFENGGWQYYPYSELGDFGNNSSARYSITVESAGTERLVVGGTGESVERSADGTRWRFEAQGVRDVAYVISPNFINPWDDAAMTRQEGQVKMLAFFLPEHREAGKRQLALCGPALAWFGSKLGAYPFDTYTIAEMGVPLERTDNYAQEYPMAYFVPSSWLSLGTEPGTWPWYIPVHEVGHQWFYSTIGSNQLIDPWLDEAMTTYVTAEYVRANFPAVYGQSWASMTGSATTGRPVSAGVFSGFANENQYSAAIYDTGSVMLDRIRKAMGDEAFYTALKDYYATYKLKRATPTNLTAILQKHSKADLGSIFATYLGY
ncbi:MAG: M1 family aminopeptidase [Chloroflexia bacterium]